MKIGVWGGTFDPVHVGHLLIAERAREQFSLDQVRWIPAAIAPHPTLKQSTDQTHRLAMVQLAIGGNSSFVCDDRELRRGGKSYTIETLNELSTENPGSELFLLLGADSLHQFGTWKLPNQICSVANIVVVARGGQSPPDLPILNQFLPNPKSIAQLEQDHLLKMPQLELSSTEIRNRVRERKSIRYCVPAAVEAYISQHRLYVQS